ncbi:MAG: LysE family translocator [Roseobacter sp.]|jgi:threonine/homoserine/homoserine lactone efflux protein|nr:LysE family translocator [Roseobacter sp.]
MDLTSLILFAGALAVVAGSPGPSVAALVARVLSRGPKSVLPFLAAMWIGEAVWLTAAILGLSYIAQTFSAVFLVLKWAGVAYLLYLAWQMWHAPTKADDATIPQTDGGWHLFGAGCAVTLGNPKIVAFYIALLPTLIDLSTVSLLGWAQLTAVMVMVLVLVDMTWVLAASAARRLLNTPRAIKIADRICASTMGGAALGIAART